MTVVPLARERKNPSPAGTVNPLMFTVVQLFAAETSSKELMVAVQSEAALVPERKASAPRERREIILVQL